MFDRNLTNFDRTLLALFWQNHNFDRTFRKIRVWQNCKCENVLSKKRVFSRFLSYGCASYESRYACSDLPCPAVWQKFWSLHQILISSLISLQLIYSHTFWQFYLILVPLCKRKCGGVLISSIISIISHAMEYCINKRVWSF